MLHLCSHVVVPWTSHLIQKTSSLFFCSSFCPIWTHSRGPSFAPKGIAAVNERDVRCFSVKSLRKPTTAAVSSATRQQLPPGEDEENKPFYVVRKGNITGIYKTLDDCRSLVYDPSCNVFKGFCLQKEVEDYLTARGLKSPSFSVSSTDVTDDFLGTLVPLGTAIPCQNQVPCQNQESNEQFSSTKVRSKKSKLKTLKATIASINDMESNEQFSSTKVRSKKSKLKTSKATIASINDTEAVDSPPVQKKQKLKKMKIKEPVLLEFDGSSKGNPGRGGAGAILRTDDGRVICRMREGLGIVTNNVAEYRAVILGMKCALRKGVTQVQVQGDSKLVCMQIQNLWRTKHHNLIKLSKEAQELKKRFSYFQINHVDRDLNSEADALANSAVELEVDETQEACEDEVANKKTKNKNGSGTH
ncbi:uncharacterized protein LOC18427722 isoform X2 [Amborella trichopoda]|uniref:RNase H type-1 domain-containing protein n=1 Tax=Amborella trichopoda TaxID=13333 RepID=W1NRU4_AMBTC|nr:uncharacterized protein LOC18427722 isoform X2 [Amborella trichopoda]ERM99686.1 hypothetical protein AMTR_s00099p00062060 [Amborella trichopoda]|eukprot:XP_006836833.1 uncharacterized protein LOC18427722 isoform X2 [Amborella trichopoda]